jgi:serine/threonine protein phosphatase PrpC
MAIQLIYGKSIQGDGRCNEDAFGCAGGAAWVMDGATALGGLRKNGLTAPAHFVSAYSEALQRMFALNETTDTRSILKTAIDRVEDVWIASDGVPSRDPAALPSATLILLRDRGHAVELVCLGDSRAIFRRHNAPAEAFGDSPVEMLDAKLIIDFKGIRAAAPDTRLEDVRDRLASQLAANRRLMNTPDGYWILSFSRDAADHAQIMTIEKSSLSRSEIVLATDGFLRLVEIFGIASYGEIFDASSEELDTYFEQLRVLERADPEAYVFARMKRSDDATCIRCRLI